MRNEYKKIVISGLFFVAILAAAYLATGNAYNCRPLVVSVIDAVSIGKDQDKTLQNYVGGGTGNVSELASIARKIVVWPVNNNGGFSFFIPRNFDGNFHLFKSVTEQTSFLMEKVDSSIKLTYPAENFQSAL
jgi:hypothetical protein